MKQSILILLVLLSCESSEIEIINDPDLAHDFILEQTHQEVKEFSHDLCSLSHYTNYLNHKACNDIQIELSEMDIQHELKISAFESLFPVIDKHNTLHGLVNEEILENYITHYFAYHHYISEHININIK